MSPRGFTAGLAELVLIVEDVPRAADFYREVVGLEPESPADEEWAWFFAGAADRSQRIALHKGSLLFEEHSPHPEGQRFGNVHFALEVPRGRLDEAVAHVRDEHRDLRADPLRLDAGDVVLLLRPGRQPARALVEGRVGPGRLAGARERRTARRPGACAPSALTAEPPWPSPAVARAARRKRASPRS